MAAFREIPRHSPRMSRAAQRTDRLAPAHHNLAAGDVAGNPSGDRADEFDRDLMRVGRSTTFRAVGLDDDALAPKRRIELQHRVPITVATHVPALSRLLARATAASNSSGV